MSSSLSAHLVTLKNRLECLNTEECENLEVILELLDNKLCEIQENETFCHLILGQVPAYTLGTEITFSKSLSSGSGDIISVGETILDRASGGGLYNSAQEGGHVIGTSPINTEWNSIYTDGASYGYSDLTDFDTRVYSNWTDAVNSLPNTTIVGLEMIMHDLNTDKYYLIEFSAWSPTGSTFTYTRTEIFKEEMCSLTFPDGTVILSASGLLEGGSGISVDETVNPDGTITYTITNTAPNLEYNNIAASNMEIYTDDALGNLNGVTFMFPVASLASDGEGFHISFTAKELSGSSGSIAMLVRGSDPGSLVDTYNFNGVDDTTLNFDIYLIKSGTGFKTISTLIGMQSPSTPIFKSTRTTTLATALSGVNFNLEFLTDGLTGTTTIEDIVITALKIN